MLITSKYVLYISFNVQSMRQPFFKRHISRADRIKKLMRDSKSLFGPLIETKKQRKKKQKLEEKKKIVHQESSMKDTEDAELLWVKKYSNNKLQRLIVTTKLQNKQVNDKDQKSLKRFSKTEIKNSTRQDTKNLIYSESNHNTEKTDLGFINTTSNLSVVTKDNCNQKTASSLNSNRSDDIARKYDRPNCETLPDIIVKNLLSFPIMSSKKDFIESTNSSIESTKILSISGRDDPETIRFPSVTNVLAQTMSSESELALQVWKQRMIEKLGEKGFTAYQKVLLEEGKLLHSCIAESLLGKEYEIPPRIESAFKSVQYILKDICYVKAIETHVAHTKLCYKGVVDCIARYRDHNYVIDWKNSDRQKLNLKYTYDAPVQLAAYIGAINASNLYPFEIKRGLLVIVYTNGAPATVHDVSDDTLQQYWTAWLRRLQQYYVKQREATTARAFTHQ
ncbi:mitochondrial genome maintenance exonuclease 1-like [Pogonomyrmex barbatus]|uniref:Mitochondrial genome maintenance exonuclease 1 n=1 Tax=Pogonomyrmex barbatus TaxID=144034 RepID=A0A6I9WL93_9HYME|nr:mitochondrial genome maintenance exonuclease 1-like [Pogonomyrmex barbatus]XP_025074932.1 mitochondrial genome maintenance exonuclease 1-like [Pogonomyrmex barbatus]